jgi:hypothetical protein
MVALRFTGGAEVDPALSADMSALASLMPPQLEDLFSIVLDFVAHPKASLPTHLRRGKDQRVVTSSSCSQRTPAAVCVCAISLRTSRRRWVALLRLTGFASRSSRCVSFRPAALDALLHTRAGQHACVSRRRMLGQGPDL